MSKQGTFMVYCTEHYKSAKNMTGAQVAALFTDYGVWDYLYACFDALHTTGMNYVIDDIDQYIAERQTS